MAYDSYAASVYAKSKKEALENLKKQQKTKKNYLKITDYSKNKSTKKKTTSVTSKAQDSGNSPLFSKKSTTTKKKSVTSKAQDSGNTPIFSKKKTTNNTKKANTSSKSTQFNIIDSNTRKDLNKANKTANNNYKKRQEQKKKTTTNNARNNTTQLNMINSDTRKDLNRVNRTANNNYKKRQEIKKYGTLEGKSQLDSTNFNLAKRISEINTRLDRFNSNNTLNTHETTIPKGLQGSVRSEMMNLTNEKMHLELQLRKAGYNPKKLVENYTEQARIEQMKRDEKALSQQAKKHPVATSIASVLTQPAEMFGALKTAENFFVGKEMNEYDKAFTGTRTNQAIRGTIAEQVNKSLGGGTLGYLGSMAYQSGMSVVDFLAMAGGRLPTKAIATVFGMKSASAGAMKTLERGGSIQDAFQVGVINGINEAVWEKVSIDNFRQMASMPVKGLKNFAKNIAKQMGIEAEEEAATELSNIIFESLTSYNTSDYKQYYMEAKKNGLSDDEAGYYALRKAGTQVLEAGLGGLMAGGMSGTAASIKGNMTGSFVTQEEYNNQKNNILHNGVINQEAFVNRVNEKVKELVQSKRQSNGINNTENITEEESESVKVQAIEEVIQEIEEVIQSQEQPVSEVERIAQENNVPVEEVVEVIENAREMARGSKPQEVSQLKNLAETLAGVDKDTSYVEDYKNTNKDDLNIGRDISSTQTMNNEKIENPLRASAAVKIKGVDDYVYIIGVSPKASNNGELKVIAMTENGQEHSINLNEVQFENDAIEQVYMKGNDIAAEYGLNGARAFVEGFANSNIDFDTYTKVFNDFYLTGGNMQKSFALTKQQSLYGEMSNIDNSVLKAMWTAGMLDSKSRVEKAQRKVNKVKKEQKGKEITKTYGIVTEYNEKISKKISKDLYNLIDIVSKPLNVKVEIVEDAGQNGYYNKETGTITLSLNSENPMLTLFSHETLHHLKQISPKAYQSFENAVINYMQIKYPNEFKERINQYRENYYKAIDNGSIKVSKDKITDKYLYEEIVANSCGLFFNDETAIAEYVNKHNKDSKSVLEAIKETLKSILNALKKVKPKTAEERMLLKNKKEFEKFQKMFWNLMDEGAKAKVDLTSETKEDTKHSLKETDSEGNKLTEAQVEFFKDSKVRDGKGRLLKVYHGTTSGEFYKFDKKYTRAANWWGKGFYFSSSKNDSESNYNSEGIDFSVKLENLAEIIQGDEGISLEEATKKAKDQLYKGDGLFEVYLNMENPLNVDDDILFKKEYYEDLIDISKKDYTYLEDSYFDYLDAISEKIYEEVEQIFNSYDGYMSYTVSDVITELAKKRDIGGISLAEISTELVELGVYDENENSLAGELARFLAEKLGYDGLIDESAGIKFSGMGDITEDTAHYIVFEPNQIKNVTNLNPTKENDDIRYSMNELRNSITEDTVNIDKLVSENDTLKQTIKQLRLTYGATRGKLKDAGSIERLAKNILKDTKSKYDVDELTKKLKTLFSFLDKNQSILWDDAVDITAGLIKEILQKSEVLNKDLYNQYKPLLDQMKNTGIYLSEDVTNEIINRYGSLRDFKKAGYGMLKISKDKALNLDSIWGELNTKYPELFDADINELDQPLILLTTLKSLQPQYENPYDLNMDEASIDLAFDTYRKYLELPRYPSLTETDKKAVDKVKEQEIIEVRKEFDKLIAKNRKENQEKVSETAKKLEEYYMARTKKVADQKEKLILKQLAKTQELEVKNKELKSKIKVLEKGMSKELSKKEKEVRKKVRAEYETKRHIKNILRLKNDFEKIFMATSGKDFIPTNLRESILNLCEVVSKNIDGEDSQAVIRQLRLMQKHYKSLEIAKSDSLRLVYDKNVLENFEELTDILESKPLSVMTAAEIKKVYELLGIINYNLSYSNKLIFEQEEANANDYMKKCHQEINAVKGTKRNFLARAKNKYGTITLDSVTAFKRMVNFAKNSSWVKLAEQLRQGEIKQNNTMMDGMDVFKPIMSGKGFNAAKKLVSGKWVDVGLRTDRVQDEDTGEYTLVGDPVLIPRSMLISLYLMNQNEQNRSHMLEGGLEVPNMKDYKDGKTSEAFAGKTRAYVTEEVLQEAFETLTEYEKQVIELTHKFFNDFARNKINEVSVQLNGYVKATVDNYFPINVSEDFIKPNMNTLLRDATIENVGTFKHRTNDTKALYLEDVFEVVQRHLKTVSKYYGLAIPLRNFSRIYGQVSETGEAPFENSLNRAIGQKWGVTGKEYIKNLIIDYNFGRIAEPSFFDKLRSNLATSALVLNVSTTVKQVSSYPASAYTLGWSPMIKALLRGGRSNLPISRADKEEIRKYTRIYDYRNMGNSTQEINELSKKGWNEKHPYLFGWIQIMDSTTQGRIWSACKYYVKSHNKNLKVGSEEYFQEVAKVFEKTLTTTQSTFTTSQRPAVLRTDNTMMKAMTMFMTENLKNYSIMYDSFGELIARKKDYRKNKNAENKKDLRQAKKNFANAMSGQIIQAVLFAALTLIGNLLLYRLDRYRDDEDGDISKEKILEETIKDSISAITSSFLWGSQIHDIIEGLLEKEFIYNIELSGFSLINDFIQAINGMKTGYGYLQEDMKETNRTIKEYTPEEVFDFFNKRLLKLGTTFGALFGLPAKNVYNMFSSGYKYALDYKNDELFKYEQNAQRSNDQISAKISKMLVNGEYSDAMDYMDKLVKSGDYSTKKIDDMLKYYLADFDTNISLAAEFLREGNAIQYKDMVAQYKELGFKQDTVISAIQLFNKRYADSLKDKDKEVETETEYDISADGERYLFSYKDLTKSLENLDEDNALIIRDEIYDAYIKKGEKTGREYTDEEIYKYMKQSITSNFKRAYLTWYENGETDKTTMAKYILINEFGYDPKVINYHWIEDYKDGYLDKK